MTEHTQGMLEVATIDGGAGDDELCIEVSGCIVNIAAVFGAGHYSTATIDGKNEPEYEVSKEEAAANARRLAACWNSCDGLSVDDLEKPRAIAGIVERLADSADIAIRQRNELLKAAKNYADRYLRDERDDRSLCIDQQHHEDVLALFDAIAKAEAK